MFFGLGLYVNRVCLQDAARTPRHKIFEVDPEHPGGIYHCLVPILLPETANLLFLNQRRTRRVFTKEFAGCEDRSRDDLHITRTRYRPG